MLIAPNGKILWRHNGVIDHATARAAIVAALTPYYAPTPPPAKPAKSAAKK